MGHREKLARCRYDNRKIESNPPVAQPLNADLAQGKVFHISIKS